MQGKRAGRKSAADDSVGTRSGSKRKKEVQKNIPNTKEMASTKEPPAKRSRTGKSLAQTEAASKANSSQTKVRARGQAPSMEDSDSNAESNPPPLPVSRRSSQKKARPHAKTGSKYAQEDEASEGSKTSDLSDFDERGADNDAQRLFDDEV
ncbi:hypothetical protein K435DRAFT_876123 [Dendrothele bispora CBS 962.96]|uniref:Uncharacterized protein n=1 Tax=Dendrothele bispora (strain CBS 962.96) TaxID=1314807 RepID=A0A4S8KST8_DENBC|nr:hypothetical protein K435DRAFT_876123 [Dendrothele bispora CBS 962.96]